MLVWEFTPQILSFLQLLTYCYELTPESAPPPLPPPPGPRPPPPVIGLLVIPVISQVFDNDRIEQADAHINILTHARFISKLRNGLFGDTHSRPQRPRSFWSAPRIATSGQVQQRKSAIHGLPVTLRMLRVKSDKSDWFWSQSIVFTKPFKTGMSLDRARGRDSWCWPKGARPLGTRMGDTATICNFQIVIMANTRLECVN